MLPDLHAVGHVARLPAAMPTLEELEAVARHGAPPRPLDDEDRARIAAGREVVEEALAAGTAVYGVTTGFGRLESVRIGPEDAAQLQINLLRSHAVGSGAPLPDEVVRGMLLLLASSLRRGHSGVRVELVELVLALLERGVTPVVPSKGSVGSSGDLAPLAHLGLVLIGEGEATVEGDRLPGGEALARAGLTPVALGPKEGLAIINGTHLMAATGALAVLDAQRLLEAAVVAVALSLEAFKGSTVPFDPRLHERRGQPGQAAVAERLRALLTAARSSRATPTAGACRIRTRSAARRRCWAPSATRSPTSPARSSASCTRSRTTRSCSRTTATSSAAATSTASRSRCRSTTSRSPPASWRRSQSAARTRSSPPATPGCRRSSRRDPASAPAS